MGWIAGPVVLLAFAWCTYYTSRLLADCYRSPNPVTGKRNYIYMDAIKANLGNDVYHLRDVPVTHNKYNFGVVLSSSRL